jgi:hypothetical protein
MALMIPPIGTKGRWQLKAPFTTQVGVLYTCGAARFFNDLENQGVDVYELCYKPFQIPESVFSADRASGQVILTLMSDTLAPLYVPTSYVLSPPDLSSYPLQHVIISASCGPLSTFTDLTFMKQQVATVISDVLGVIPTINLGVVPLSTTLTPTEYATMEAAREALITNRTTDHARLLEMTRQRDTAVQQNIILTKIIKDHGLIP